MACLLSFFLLPFFVFALWLGICVEVVWTKFGEFLSTDCTLEKQFSTQENWI